MSSKPVEHRARKRFGQNFLHDPAVIQRIISAVAPAAGQRVVEIGPGLGALTLPLLRSLGRLDVVELDRDIIPKLQAQAVDAGELRIHQADALRFDFSTLCEPGEKLRLIGNLPYNISTPILFHLLKQAECIADMHFMLQREVVERMVAGPGSKTYGRLSVSLAMQAHCEPLFLVGPGAFKPAPKVESAVVRITPQSTSQQPRNQAIFEHVVSKAFSARRKTITNGLRDLLTREQIAEVDIDPGCRPEQISPDGFRRLADLINSIE
jgi:16S rRNA (adenine1518-N6/adenine1519-N6)-dimethyltransferase